MTALSREHELPALHPNFSFHFGLFKYFQNMDVPMLCRLFSTLKILSTQRLLFITLSAVSKVKSYELRVIFIDYSRK